MAQLNRDKPYGTLVGGSPRGFTQDGKNFTVHGEEADANFVALPKRSGEAKPVEVKPAPAAVSQIAKQVAKA